MGVVSFWARADGEKLPLTSPDKNWRIEIEDVSVQNGGNPYTYNIIRVLKKNSIIKEYSLHRTATESPRYVYACKWSSDSRFCVFLCINAHNSSIWHMPTTIYDTITNKFIDLDQQIGAVVDDHIEFKDHDILKIKVLGPDGADGEPLVKEVSLAKLAKQE
jgi:hypothetical protein